MGKNKQNEEQTFHAIIQDAIEQAERVDVPFAEFVEGLQLMRDEIQQRYEWARVLQVQKRQRR